MESILLTSTFTKLRESLRLRARAILGSGSDADDAVQDAFCRLWSSPSLPQSTSHAEALSRTAVRNASIDLLRRNIGVSDSDIGDVGDEAEEPDNSDELFEAVSSIIDAQLSERDRKMLRLREMNGYDWDELAAMFGVTEGNARMIVSRARKTVRDCYRHLHN